MCKSQFIRLKLFIPAGIASATPPLGPILSQYGVNTAQFCNEFNLVTEGLTLFFDDESFSEFIVSTEILISDDRSYQYLVKKPSVSFLLRILTEVNEGKPTKVVGTITRRELVFLAKFKFPKLKLSSACRILMGTARSIGIRVVS